MKGTTYNPTQRPVHLAFSDPSFQAFRQEQEGQALVMAELLFPLPSQCYTVTVIPGKRRPQYQMHAYWQHTICDFGHRSSIYRSKIVLFFSLMLCIACDLAQRPAKSWLLAK